MSHKDDYEFCAGVLPFCYFNNNMYLLMGKNRKGRLCTFSGKNEVNESIIDTASREMYEETCGLVMSREELLQKLQRGDGIMVNSKTPRGKQAFTLLVEIPYRRWYSIAFVRTQSFLLKNYEKKHKHTEMVDLKWISADNLFTNVRRSWERCGMHIEDGEWCKIEKLRNRNPNIDVSNWRATMASSMQPDSDRSEEETIDGRHMGKQSWADVASRCGPLRINDQP